MKLLEHNNFNWKHIVAIFGLFLVIGALTAAIILTLTQEPEEEVAAVESQEVCSEALLTVAAPLLKATQLDELGPVVGRIEGLENYDQDLNCLYVVTNYYIGLSEGEAANTELVKLEGLYESGSRYSDILAAENIPLEPDELRSIVNYLLELQQDGAGFQIYQGADLPLENE